MLTAGGGKLNICWVCSGKDELKNVFPNFRNERNGLTLKMQKVVTKCGLRQTAMQCLWKAAVAAPNSVNCCHLIQWESVANLKVGDSLTFGGKLQPENIHSQSVNILCESCDILTYVIKFFLPPEIHEHASQPQNNVIIVASHISLLSVFSV